MKTKILQTYHNIKMWCLAKYIKIFNKTDESIDEPIYK